LDQSLCGLIALKAAGATVGDGRFPPSYNALQQDKVPVLINTGALYGTGIHNIHIMENEIVMKAAQPLIILYPATIEPDRIMFLGKHPASKYRCMIIQ